MNHNHFPLLYSLPCYLISCSILNWETLRLTDVRRAFASLQPCFSICFCRSLLPPFSVCSLSPLHHLPLRRPRPSIRLGSMRRPALLFDQPYESSDLKPSARAAPWSEREPCRRLPAFSRVHSIVRVGSLRGVTCNNHRYLFFVSFVEITRAIVIDMVATSERMNGWEFY